MAGMQGVLLCGGLSSRMGEPKGLLPLHGTTTGLYLGGLLADVCGCPPLLAGAGPVGEIPADWRRLDDPPKVRGPLAGLLAVHLVRPVRPLLVLAVDLVAMNQEALRWLIDQFSRCDRHHLALWPHLPKRPFGEPLAAVYRPDALAAMHQAWLQGEIAVHRSLARDLRFEPEVPADLQGAFTGVNTPEEWTAFQSNKLK